MDNQVKKVVINAKDLWTALTNCDQMSLLRKYFINQDIYADSLFSDAEFDSNSSDITFIVKHPKFPEITVKNQVKSLKLPGLRNKNEPAQ